MMPEQIEEISEIFIINIHVLFLSFIYSFGSLVVFICCFVCCLSQSCFIAGIFRIHSFMFFERMYLHYNAIKFLYISDIKYENNIIYFSLRVQQKVIRTSTFIFQVRDLIRPFLNLLFLFVIKSFGAHSFAFPHPALCRQTLGICR